MLTLGKHFLFSGKTILVAPLDWGLGHATRCVPLIRSLTKENNVLIGVTAGNAFFFEQHFPQLEKVTLPSYNLRYSATLPVWLKVLLQWPKLRRVIAAEHRLLEQVIITHGIDTVISDNRFGLSHRSVACIFISHQLCVKAPFFSFLVNRMNRKYIHQFNEVCVPDYKEPDRRLSGQLSDSVGIKIPVTYIGPQSHLRISTVLPTQTEKADFLILLSGTEPQRSILEQLLVEKFRNSAQNIVLVRGSKAASPLKSGAIKTIDFVDGAELAALIVSAGTVICRSGYSTLMDLHMLGKQKLILIPTPGQTEQEYLATYWNQKFGAVHLKQQAILHHVF